MGKKAIAAGLALALFVLVAAIPAAEPAAGSCNDVVKAVAACVGYVTGKVAAPSAGCCSGVRTLNAQATTAAARRAVCSCLKQAVGQNRAVRDELVSAVPAKCSVAVPFRFSVKTNCNTIP